MSNFTKIYRQSGFRTSDKKMSFTLVELLVVIAIISILAGMLLPALERARDAAKSADCTSKMKNMGLAANMYSSDNDDFAVPCYYKPVGYSGDAYECFYYRKLRPYIADNFGGPYDGISKATTRSKNAASICDVNIAKSDECYTNYGWNRCVGYHDSGTTLDALGKISQIKRPSVVVYGTDAYSWRILYACSEATPTSNMSGYSYMISYPHLEKANTLHPDGHSGTVGVAQSNAVDPLDGWYTWVQFRMHLFYK